uniref:Uncharacterized protein n=1 Tax=Heterorhabditis bacteriophora TaxID=37862 RepID=A0A1I7WX80_HETBA
MAPWCHKAPEAVQHLSAKRFRSVQNYYPSSPQGEWELSSEAKPRLLGALRQMPRLKKALKNREKNSPINLHLSQSSNSPSKCTEKLIAGSLFWMAIVAEHSIGRVRQVERERNGNAFRFLNGTDPALQIPLRLTYTTRPSQDL